MTNQSLDRVPEPLRAALERRGFTDLTEVQTAALETCGESRDLQISSQTGSGKTVALGLVMAPTLLAEAVEGAVVAGPAALIIVPTRELAAQVSAELAWLYADISAVTLECVTGGTHTGGERARLKRRPRVLVGTPGRLLDHVKSGALSLADVRHLVLDEADQMLDMGFREDLEAILDTTPPERRTHLVSATFPEGIRRLTERYQRDAQTVEGTALGQANGDIEHLAYRVREGDRYAALVNLLLVGGEERTLVFVNTRSETSVLAEKLTADGFSALPLSGELVQAQRTRTLAAFKSGAVSVLVATDVASRGLDVPDVATVVHTAPCMDGEIYTHRSGRTGRAGNKGRSILLVPPRQERRVRNLLVSAGVSVEWGKVPTSAQVAKLVAKRTRRATWEAIANAPAATEERLAEAQRLLEGRDPAELVAALLDMNKSANEPKPREVAEVSADTWKENRGARHEGEPRFGDKGPRYGARPANGARPAGGSAGSASFNINWGHAGGASPKRLLAHICRRGGIQGREVGAIRLDSHSSTFQVEERVAKQFEMRVRTRDSRDPHLRIQRAWQKPQTNGKSLARA